MTAATYLSPDGTERAQYARLERRAGAAALDWVLCYVGYLLVSIPAGMLQIAGRPMWDERDLGGVPGAVLLVLAQALPLVVPVAYFAAYLMTGQTLGMRAVDVHAVVRSTGRDPGRLRALLRALLALALAAAVYLVAFAAISDPGPEGWSHSERVILTVALAIALPAAAAKLLALVDPRRQSVLDRLFDLVWIDEIERLDRTRSRRYGWVDVPR